MGTDLSSLPDGSTLVASPGEFSWKPEGDVVRFGVETSTTVVRAKLSSSEARTIALGLFNAAEKIDPQTRTLGVRVRDLAHAGLAAIAIALGIGAIVFVIRIAWRLGGGG
jgi:hypothetical protein